MVLPPFNNEEQKHDVFGQIVNINTPHDNNEDNPTILGTGLCHAKVIITNI